MNLKPCPHRRADDEGHILCDKIKSGDREVSPNVCRACPVSAINCAHLRATLAHHARPPITVRWGNGKTEVWDAVEPTLALQRAACAAKVTPILSPRDCAACAMRQSVDSQQSSVNSQQSPVNSRQSPVNSHQSPVNSRQSTVSGQPSAVDAPPAPTTDARGSAVAHKIIQLQEWLAKHKNAAPPHDDADAENAVRPIAVGAGRMTATPHREEKRVGWTD